MRDAIREANRTEDAAQIRKIMDTLRFKHGFNYLRSREFFKACDPMIDDNRFEELCQLADREV